MEAPLTAAQLQALAALNTPIVSNAIETFNLRLRNEGYITNSLIKNQLPKLQPMVGYAVTLQMRTDSPPMRGKSYLDRSDWWDMLASFPSPKIIVIQDTSRHPAIGSVAGEIHGSIYKALGAIGIVTNGAVRDLDALEAIRLHVYASALSPSHAYAHIVEVGAPVEIDGLAIENGDLLHGDQHGIIKVPLSTAADIPKIAHGIMEHERRIIEFCNLHTFSIENLRKLVSTLDDLNNGGR